MIAVGDAVHNFTDGLAMGASFQGTILLGIVSTLAIVFHELPQELGYFSSLLAKFSRNLSNVFKLKPCLCLLSNSVHMTANRNLM